MEDISLRNYLNSKILYNESKLEDLGINFVLPGYNNIELKQKGTDIFLDIFNIEEYVNLILNSLCFEGINHSIEEFKKGFNILFSVTSLNCFSSDEICDFLSVGNNEKWDRETLLQNILTNHGYDRNS
jgi:E3 ubiquitin-protein ligase TRIP12